MCTHIVVGIHVYTYPHTHTHTHIHLPSHTHTTPHIYTQLIDSNVLYPHPPPPHTHTHTHAHPHTHTGTEFTSPYSRILLTPDLSDAVSTRDKEPFAPSLSSPQSPSLGLLIRHLKECTEGYSASLESYQQYGKKLETTGNLSSEEMRQVCDLFGHCTSVSTCA